MSFVYKIFYRHRWLLKFVAGLVLVPLSALIKKNANLLLFHGSDLDRFSENGRYLFIYLHHESAFDVIWMTSSRALRDELAELGFNAKIHASLSGIWCYLRAACVIGSGSRYPDFAGAVGSNTLKVCLHHGSGPRTTNGMPDGGQLDFVHYTNKWDYFNFTSRWMSASVGKLQFFLPHEKRIVFGYPRCDHLLDPNTNFGELQHRSLPSNYDPKLKSKIILFAPTWRDGLDFNWNTLEYLNGFNIKEFSEFLEVEDMIMYVSIHPKSKIPSEYEWPDRIKLIEQGVLFDINEFLPYVDVLISDYSSIATDFLLMGRPVIYNFPDYDYYLGSVGLLEPIKSLNPGLVVETFDDLQKALRIAAKAHNRFLSKDYQLYFEKYYEPSLGGACARFHDFFKDVLK